MGSESENFTQDYRPLKIDTPLGKDKLLLEALSGYEAVSEPFFFHLELLALKDAPFDFDKLLNQKATVTMWLKDAAESGEMGEKRYFHGFVTKLTQGRPVRGTEGKYTLI